MPMCVTAISSGVLLNEGFNDFISDTRIKIVCDLAATILIAPFIVLESLFLAIIQNG